MPFQLQSRRGSRLYSCQRWRGGKLDVGMHSMYDMSNQSQILGIGDQGVGAILISVAKLALTTLCAGIHPSRQLPVVLDCGTDVWQQQVSIRQVLIIEYRMNHFSRTSYTWACDSRALEARNMTSSWKSLWKRLERGSPVHIYTCE